MALPVKNLTQVLVLVVLFCFVKSIISNLYQAYQTSDIKKLTPHSILKEMLNPDGADDENESMVNIASLAVLVYLCVNNMC